MKELPRLLSLPWSRSSIAGISKLSVASLVVAVSQACGGSPAAPCTSTDPGHATPSTQRILFVLKSWHLQFSLRGEAKVRPSLTRSGAFIVLSLLPFFVANARSAHQEKIEVAGERPLHALIKEIEKRYGFVITYEDSPYFNAAEALDVTARRRPGSKKPILTPLGGRFEFTPPSAGSGFGLQRSMVSRLVSEYNRYRPSAVFDLEFADGVFHVFPRETLDRNGVLRPYRSILDVPVSIAPGDRSGTEMLSAILSIVSPLGARRLLLATPAPSPFDYIRFQDGFDRVNARKAIMTVVSRVTQPQSWQVMCQPGEGEACYFSTAPPGVW